MCGGKPDIEKPVELQSSKEPVYSDAQRKRTGREGTVTRSYTGGDVGKTSALRPSFVDGLKKKLLGQ